MDRFLLLPKAPLPTALLLLSLPALSSAASDFKLVSKAFDNGEAIPAEYLKDEDNISPVTPQAIHP